ncbi:MAG: hypothetical protein DRI26_08070, partial [Chloroflexi bacterium]
MKVEIFDDRWSIGHLLLGALAIEFPFVFAFFVLYEVIEFCYKYKRKQETVECFVGDLLEFMLGLGYGYIITQIPVENPVIREMLKGLPLMFGVIESRYSMVHDFQTLDHLTELNYGLLSLNNRNYRYGSKSTNLYKSSTAGKEFGVRVDVVGSTGGTLNMHEKFLLVWLYVTKPVLDILSVKRVRVYDTAGNWAVWDLELEAGWNIVPCYHKRYSEVSSPAPDFGAIRYVDFYFETVHSSDVVPEGELSLNCLVCGDEMRVVDESVTMDDILDTIINSGLPVGYRRILKGKKPTESKYLKVYRIFGGLELCGTAELTAMDSIIMLEMWYRGRADSITRFGERYSAFGRDDLTRNGVRIITGVIDTWDWNTFRIEGEGYIYDSEVYCYQNPTFVGGKKKELIDTKLFGIIGHRFDTSNIYFRRVTFKGELFPEFTAYPPKEFSDCIIENHDYYVSIFNYRPEYGVYDIVGLRPYCRNAISIPGSEGVIYITDMKPLLNPLNLEDVRGLDWRSEGQILDVIWRISFEMRFHDEDGNPTACTVKFIDKHGNEQVFTGSEVKDKLNLFKMLVRQEEMADADRIFGPINGWYANIYAFNPFTIEIYRDETLYTKLLNVEILEPFKCTYNVGISYDKVRQLLEQIKDDTTLIRKMQTNRWKIE